VGKSARFEPGTSESPPTQTGFVIEARRVKSFLRKIAQLLLWPFVAGYMLLNGLLLPAFRPLIAAFSRLPLFGRLCAWLLTIPPYPAMLLFAIPFAILEPLKLLALYWTAIGHVLTGTVAMIVLHGLSILSTERLFAVLKPTFLTIPWFAALWGRITSIRDRLLAWVRETRAWAHLGRLREQVRRIAARIAAWVREVLA
jgi:hypothetical protein